MLPVLVALAVASGLATSAPAPAARKGARCDRPENRQFDFWIGHWQVSDTKDNSAQGESTIELLYDGCTIRENWRDPQLRGGSLNAYVAADGRWHQLWTDSSGAWREFTGGIVNGEMVLVSTFPSMTQPNKLAHSKMTFTPNPDGTVRQHQVQWIDGGNIVEGYDYTYRRAVS